LRHKWSLRNCAGRFATREKFKTMNDKTLMAKNGRHHHQSSRLLRRNHWSSVINATGGRSLSQRSVLPRSLLNHRISKVCCLAVTLRLVLVLVLARAPFSVYPSLNLSLTASSRSSRPYHPANTHCQQQSALYYCCTDYRRAKKKKKKKNRYTFP
jgi:hypothetical protein